eukprot:TRINITY_DN6770_c0_g1_i1.p3 TRINITY_DN6770_c0_g1~~TRINITY_DN6770_c0_g1_i1.p3  ORF type:complete len:152 (-),score=26.53 TRINITY_DN6770_c0_g1_i1:37-492(-)
MGLQIWDTAGQERFKTITSAYYKGADGIMLAYDCGNKDSFESLDNWLFEIEKNATPGVIKMLLANKSDLQQKLVPQEAGAEFADKNKLFFMETSALQDFQVARAFEKMAEKLMEGKEGHDSSRESSVTISSGKSMGTKIKSLRESFSRCCQ